MSLAKSQFQRGFASANHERNVMASKLCGYKGKSGATCTRDKGHAGKHAYPKTAQAIVGTAKESTAARAKAKIEAAAREKEATAAAVPAIAKAKAQKPVFTTTGQKGEHDEAGNTLGAKREL